MATRLTILLAAPLSALATAPAAAQAPPAAPPPAVAQAEAEPDPVEEAPAEPAPPPPTATAEAAAETPSLVAPKISGYVDATYNYNTRDPAGGVTPFHTYTGQHDTVLLNAAHVALTGSGNGVSYAVEVDVGHDAQVTSGNEDDIDLQEAYVAYASPIGLGLKAGKFVTYQGIEVIESGSNPTISRGFLFGLAEPFTHVGAVLTFQINPQFDVAAGVVNGWDLVVDNNTGKTFVGKVGYAGDGVLVTASGYVGPEKEDNEDDLRMSGDLTGMVKVGGVDLWGQVNAGSEEASAADGEDAAWFGFGIQPVWHVLEEFAVGARGELFRDLDGARTGADQTLYNVTITPAYTLAAGLVVRGEVRVDWSNEDVFMDEDGTVHGSQVVALTEAIYSF